MKDVMEEQKKQFENEKQDLELKVVKVVKENNMRKKIIIVLGDIEGHTLDKKAREKETSEKVEKVLECLQKENGWKQGIEEVRRTGVYNGGESRPIRVQFKFSEMVDQIMGITWKLSLSEETNKYHIKRDISIEERKVP